MSATPPQKWPHVCEPTDAQLKQAKRIASKTGKTTEQVLAEAISRGTSVRMTDVFVRGVRPNTKPR